MTTAPLISGSGKVTATSRTRVSGLRESNSLQRVACIQIVQDTLRKCASICRCADPNAQLYPVMSSKQCLEVTHIHGTFPFIKPRTPVQVGRSKKSRTMSGVVPEVVLKADLAG